ncbi:MAG: C/D box methylation guide ribonucleoprotein complex aNOP56 subunit [Thermofilum sp.]|nr:C/D box methylation guide ribonucleoprotein complex aNOP56 subunit [Thermofilum sp.]
MKKLRGYLVCTPLALMVLDDGGNVVASVRLPEDPAKAADELIRLEEGEVPPSLIALLEKVKSLEELVVEDADLKDKLAKHFPGTVIVQPNNSVASSFRERLPEYFKVLNVSEEQYRSFVYEVSLALTRRKVRKAAEKRDLFIAQAISALDDINKTLNLFASRVREWYGLHFPELDELLEEHEDFVKVVSKIGSRDAITEEALKSIGIKDELAKKIAEAAETSMGADLTEFDLQAIRLLADVTLDLFERRRALEKYIDEAMMEVAPNIRGLVGPLLGARLIALAGGLAKLATMPASTIQVLGAEKALFRALRTGGKPPKHGVIFQHPAIHRSPKWQRGKIARALAAKLAIAARIDAFTGEYRADELREQLEERIKEIKTLYAKPPPKREPQPKERGRGRRGPARPRRGSS